MAVAQKIALYDKVELLEPVDTAPAGARGPVNHFLNGGEVAEIELTEPHLEGLDGIVYAPRSKLRRIGLIPPSPGKVPKRPARDG